MSLVRLDIQLQAFSQNNIMNKIPEDVLRKIKETDDHPFFQLYSICHEGISQPKLLGKKSRPIVWMKKAIQSIKNVIKKGIKFFDGHNITNDDQNQEELGEVIHSYEDEIDGKLHHCVIGYFPPETRDKAKEKDACSQEATWNLIEAGENLIADVCEKISGIALVKSSESKPAFKDAKRLAYIQAFEDNNTPTGEVKLGDNLEEKKTMTLVELKQKVRELNVFPHQLYSLDEIKDDREFGQVYDEIKTKETNIQEKEKELTETKTKNTELSRKIQLNSAKGKLKDIYKELELTENMTKFVDEIYEDSKTTIQDLTDEGLKKFVENQKNIFQKATNTIEPQENVNIPTGDTENKETEESNPFLEDSYNPEDYI